MLEAEDMDSIQSPGASPGKVVSGQTFLEMIVAFIDKHGKLASFVLLSPKLSMMVYRKKT